MQSAWDGFVKKHDFLVCVDTDGCVMDTMNSKHIHCFGPYMIDEWGLHQWEEPILRRWNEINLFQLTRGINRYKALVIAMEEVSQRYTPIVGLQVLSQWIEDTPVLSNELLIRKIEESDDEDGKICLKKALRWSMKVNEAITKLPEKLKLPFHGAKSGLIAASAFADVVVVTSANRDAVEEEWVDHGFMPYTDLILAQDCGGKGACIEKLLEYGYEADHVLMVGDAVSDMRSAQKNGIWFYPILVNWEEECWEAFQEEILPAFKAGEYGLYQQEKIQVFIENLGG